jgi:hypothetical protein
MKILKSYLRPEFRSWADLRNNSSASPGSRLSPWMFRTRSVWEIKLDHLSGSLERDLTNAWGLQMELTLAMVTAACPVRGGRTPRARAGWLFHALKNLITQNQEPLAGLPLSSQRVVSPFLS